MKTKIRLYYLIGWLLYIPAIILPRPGQAQRDYTFHKLTNNEGLSYNTVNDIVQDSSGLLWIATKHGLNKYDSYGFTRYYMEDHPGLSSNIITRLIITSDNTLLIGTVNGLTRYLRSFDRFEEITLKGEPLPNVTCLLEAPDGKIIIGTVNGLFRYFPEEKAVINLYSLRESQVNAVVPSPTGSLLVATFTGLYEINMDGIIQHHYHAGNSCNLPTNLIQQLYRDRAGNIWVGTVDRGLFQFETENQVFHSCPLCREYLAGSEFIREISEDPSGKLWVGTEMGLFILDEASGASVHVQQSLEESEQYLNDNAIYSLYPGQENIMWIGTYFGGINYTKLENNKNFMHLHPGNDRNELRGKAVNRLFKDSQGRMWIATEDGGVCTFDPKSQSILEYFQYAPDGGLSSNNIHSICEDPQGRIWLGHFQTGIDIYDPVRKTFRHVFPNPDEKDKFAFNSVYSLFLDSKDQLWIGTMSNVRKYDFKNRAFIPFKPELFNNVFTYNIMEDIDGNIWFCMRDSGLVRYSPDGDTLVHYLNGTHGGKGLSSNQVISSAIDSRKRLWFGTMGGGVNLYHDDKDSFEVISMKDGLPNATIYGIIEDNDRRIWLSSNTGLSRLDPASREIKNYSIKDGLNQMQFNYSSYFKDEETGMLYFGSIGGLTYFDPSSIGDNTSRPTVMLTDFKLFNNSVEIGDKSPLTRHINETPYIRLKYRQNVFTLDFVAINYSSPGSNQFYYYLEGFEDYWNDAGNRTSVTYTNLSPGLYKFRVKAFNNDHYESNNIKELDIRVLRPWWLSTIALIVYGIIFIAILLILRRITIIREKEKSALKIEKLEKERMQQLNQQRFNFFTFISHEFKTPLSIILASIEDLVDHLTVHKELNSHFDRIKRSARRLYFLIDQLMDFRKIETKHAKLVMQRGEIIQFVRETCLAFSPIYARHGINFEFTSSVENYICWFDSDKIEKIITNLISNAIKYTPGNGTISCETDILDANKPDHEYIAKLSIRVANTGAAMNEEELQMAFTLFHMDDKKHEGRHGTGIGLTLVKSLVEYLGGSISADASPSGGTRFTIILPVNLRRASNIKLESSSVEAKREIDVDHVSFLPDSDIRLEQEEQDPGLFHILIVEDTGDMAEFLIHHYSSKYRTSYANNGNEALDLVRQEEPDLIISDIMMPGMSGLELCREIKSNESTSHIAVILLTARVTHEDKLEGLKAGAEAYVSKPFDVQELDLHVRHFIELRRKIRKTLLIGKALDMENLNLHEKDKKFIENVTGIINRNIGNESFTIEEMADELGMSKTLVYLKHKKLLSMSAKEYLQLLRFKKAIELMLGSDQNISEIAYEVGFSDPNYFSRAFKKFYHLTPTEYKEQMNRQMSEMTGEAAG